MSDEWAASGEFIQRAGPLVGGATEVGYGYWTAIGTDFAFVTYADGITSQFDTDVYVRTGQLWALSGQKINTAPGRIIQAFNGETAVFSAIPFGATQLFIYHETTPGVWAEVDDITCPDPDAFGDVIISAVALSPDGEWLAMGAESFFNRSYVFMFRWNGSAYTLADTINDPDPGDNGQAGFGQAVALSDEGTLVVGSPSSNENATNAGRAFVYTVAGSTWSLDQTVDTSGSTPNGDNYGTSVDITADGSKLVVGDSKSAVEVFSRAGSYSLDDRLWSGNSFRDTDAKISDDGLTVATQDIDFQDPADSGFVVYELGDAGWVRTQNTIIPHGDVTLLNQSVVGFDASDTHVIVAIETLTSGDFLGTGDVETFIYSRDFAAPEGPYSDFWTGFEKSEERVDETCE